MHVSLDQRIESTPGVCGGKPRIAGRRIRVQDIAALYEFHGMSPDEIVAGYPQLTLTDVHAALAYYHAHRDEIHAQMKADDDFIEKLKHENPSSVFHPGTDARGDSLPSR